MRKVLLPLILVATAIAQAPPPDVIRLRDLNAQFSAAIDNASENLIALQEQAVTLTQQLADARAEIATLKDKLAQIPPPAPMDPLISWLKSWTQDGDAQPYSLLRQMAAYPITSYYSPGAAITPEGERYTLVCLSNSKLVPVVGPTK